MLRKFEGKNSSWKSKKSALQTLELKINIEIKATAQKYGFKNFKAKNSFQKLRLKIKT